MFFIIEKSVLQNLKSNSKIISNDVGGIMCVVVCICMYILLKVLCVYFVYVYIYIYIYIMYSLCQ